MFGVSKFDFGNTILGDRLGGFLNETLEVGREVVELQLKELQIKNGAGAALGVDQNPNAVNIDGSPTVVSSTTVAGVKASTLLIGGVAVVLGGVAATFVAKKG